MVSEPGPLEDRERSHSGRLLLRMPQRLHGELAARSDRDGVSLNQWIVDALTRSLAPDAPPPRVVPRGLRLALIANAVVVAVAAAVAVALILIAWR
jgi:HicB family